MIRVVADAGPLLALAKLNLLHLLDALFERVELTTSVYDEIVVSGMRRGYVDAQVLREYFYLKGWAPTAVEADRADHESWRLDQGETDSIILARTEGVELLMDEERGRVIARREGVHVRGTLGILVQAYRQNLITSDQLRLYVNQLAERKDIWISPVLCREVLRQVLG